MDVYGLRGSSANHSVADCQRPCPKRRIPIQKVFTPVYHTLRDTGTLPGLYVPAEREVNQDADEKSILHVYSLVSLDASCHCGRQLSPTCSVNVWCAVLDDQVISRFSVNIRLNGQMQHRFLQEDLPSILEYMPLKKQGLIYFQHHGVPPHFSRAVRYLLYDHFHGQWIGRGVITKA